MRWSTARTLEVTDRGRPVAILGPLPEPVSPLDRLVAARRARRPGRDLEELLPPRGRVSTKLSEALLEERAERL
jgi:antitoxin (DNA-binding transcriptional repressor) of toxin-antitoxin stability system